MGKRKRGNEEGLKWTNTRQCTNVDGWCINVCTFFVPPCPKTNQGGKCRLTFFSSLQPKLIFSSPPTPTYLPTFKLHAYAPWLPPSLAYLLTHPYIYLVMNIYTKFHQGNGNIGQWRYGNILGRLLCCPSYLPNRPCNFMIIKNNVAMTQMKVL